MALVSVGTLTNQKQYVGNSKDEKPTSAATGAKLFESDTRREWLFDGDAWVIIADPVGETDRLIEAWRELVAPLHEELTLLRALLETQIGTTV